MFWLDFMRVFRSLLPHQCQNLISIWFSKDISYFPKIQSLFNFPCYCGIREERWSIYYLCSFPSKALRRWSHDRGELEHRLKAILSAGAEGYREDVYVTIRTLTAYYAVITNRIQQYKGWCLGWQPFGWVCQCGWCCELCRGDSAREDGAEI